MKSPSKPIGFSFSWANGVGKTELAKVLANYLFSHPDALVKIDMSEFSEKFALSRLLGAPPGMWAMMREKVTEKIRQKSLFSSII